MNFYVIVMNYTYGIENVAKEFFTKSYIVALRENKAVEALARFSKHIKLHYRNIDISDIGIKRLPDAYEWIKETQYILMLENTDYENYINTDYENCET